MRNKTRPIISFVGLVLFLLTLVINLCFKNIRTTDVGVGMLLSLANALMLVFTLLWSVMGVIELRNLLKLRKEIKEDLDAGTITNEEYQNIIKPLKFGLTINVSYLVVITCQFIYVIYNWDEVNV